MVVCDFCGGKETQKITIAKDGIIWFNFDLCAKCIADFSLAIAKLREKIEKKEEAYV